MSASRPRHLTSNVSHHRSLALVLATERADHFDRSGSIRHRRVVQEDAHLAVVILLVAEGVLDLGLGL